MTRAHALSIAIGATGVLSAVAGGIGILGDTAKCLATSWTAEAPLLTTVAGICAATAPFFAMLVKSTKETR